MSKKKIIFFIVSLFFLFLIWYISHNKFGAEKYFQRFQFFNLKQATEFNKHHSRTEQNFNGKIKNSTQSVIPNKKVITFRGKRTLLLKPGVKGRKGILFSISVKSKKRKIEKVTISIVRDKRTLFQKKLKSNKKKINYLFSETFKFEKNDVFKIEVKGEGIVVIKDAVIYDIIKEKKRKYVFVIAIDNLRKDEVGKKVNGVELTPNLNKLLRDSVYLKNTYAQSSWTLPSFISFFTGLYEFNHLITRYTNLDSKKPFLMENFSRRYINISINGGAWLSGKNVDLRGFDYFKKGSRIEDVYAAEKFFNNTIEFIKKNQVPRLFMFLHTFAIHAPYYPPKPFLLKLNKNPSFYKLGSYTQKRQYFKNVSQKKRDSMEELYEADIMAFDHYFGKFIEYLKTKKIYKKSLIVFTSDHGEEFYEHKGWFHGHSLYNEMIKVPLIIKFPNNKYKGLCIQKNVGVMDILPTLMDYLKIKNSNKIDGISLMPLVKGKTIKRKILVSSTTSCYMSPILPKKIALFFKNYKMIYNFDLSKTGKEAYQKFGMPPDTAKIELFDLTSDPNETKNIYHKHTRLVKKLQKKLSNIIKIVKYNLKQKSPKKNQLSTKELETLKSLGYL